MSPIDFVKKHNRENPYWKWTFDEVNSDVDFLPKSNSLDGSVKY